MKRLHTFALTVLGLVALMTDPASGQAPQNADKFHTWLPYQGIPSFTFYTGTPNSAFGFEWELTPVLYSFGMNKQISPWYFFIVEPPGRFTGSIELNFGVQAFTRKVGSSYFGFSGTVIGFIPLIERGEHLTLNLGASVYRFGDRTPVFGIVGVSTLFGILHLNIKHSPSEKIWITSLEWRVF
ncbi:MAG: hypothetical protein IH628_12830 [Proteobacteria bacterium]|nr:hypothetical protein [Pseudomonadota bacterium]